MIHYNYQDVFKSLYDKAVRLYNEGNRDKDTYFNEKEQAALAANGWRAQDFFDYAEDVILGGEPSYEIAQSIEQARREYFLHIQNGEPSSKRIQTEDLPGKKEAIDGIEWLPRIITKAIGKLRGELTDDTMYCCGGDRNFLQTHDIHPSEFLRVAWANQDDPSGIVEFVKQRSRVANAT